MAYKDPEKQRAANLEYYRRNKEKYRLAADRMRAENRERVAAIKAETPCADCGHHYHPVCMDFDHVADNKTSGVAELVAQRASWRRIEEEIAKCEIVCANCHRLRTAERAALARRDVL